MKTSTLRKNHTVGQIQSGPKSSGPRGPPKNSVTMIAEMVTTFMNSAM